jgi:asparagine N-glycosylation enzyme membrane subunit Stt3
VQPTNEMTLDQFLVVLGVSFACFVVGVTIGVIKDRNFRALVGKITAFGFAAIFGTAAALVALFLIVKFIKWAWYY